MLQEKGCVEAIFPVTNLRLYIAFRQKNEKISSKVFVRLRVGETVMSVKCVKANSLFTGLFWG